MFFAILSVLPLLQFARTSSFLYASVRTNDLVFILIILLAGAAASAAIVLIYKTRAVFTEWRSVLCACAAVLAGLSLCLYVPSASMTNPPMNWGYARTAGGFVHTLTRGQYEMIRPTPRPAQLGKQLRAYATTVAGDWGTVCLLPALLLPFVWRSLKKNGRAWLGALASVYLCLTVLLITVLNPATDLNGQSMTKVFYSLSYVVLSLWLGYGITVAVALFAKSSGSTGVPAS